MSWALICHEGENGFIEYQLHPSVRDIQVREHDGHDRATLGMEILNGNEESDQAQSYYQNGRLDSLFTPELASIYDQLRALVHQVTPRAGFLPTPGRNGTVQRNENGDLVVALEDLSPSIRIQAEAQQFAADLQAGIMESCDRAIIASSEVLRLAGISEADQRLLGLLP